MADFQISGKMPDEKDNLNKIDKGNANDEDKFFRNKADRPSGPLDVFGFNCLRCLYTTELLKSILLMLIFVVL